MIYDFDLPWALDIAKQTGIQSAGFATQTPGAMAAYCMLNLKVHGKTLNVPALDIPDFLDTGVSAVVDGPGLDRIFPVLRVSLSKFGNFGRADIYFCQTFDKMEHEVLEWMKNICPTIAAIWPMVPSAYLESRMEDSVDYGFNMNNQDRNARLEWLDIAFGSMTGMKTEEIKEMAMVLKNLGRNFLWVMKETEMPNLTTNFVEEA